MSSVFNRLLINCSIFDLTLFFMMRTYGSEKTVSSKKCYTFYKNDNVHFIKMTIWYSLSIYKNFFGSKNAVYFNMIVAWQRLQMQQENDYSAFSFCN